MGLFSFIKTAGEALAGGKPPTAESLVEHIKALNLKIDKLFISWDGKTCILFGNVPDQAEKEKAILAVGNLSGVDQVVDKLKIEAGAGAGGTSTAAAAPEAVDPSKEAPGQTDAAFYTVKSGDNLSKIAKEHYGDANKYPAVFEANKPMLKSPDKIYPGQVLRLPKL
ncbi:MAG: peptidoglycan-binding protein LysM [Nevskia sp.]|nr:peptidoglycan-binding protein LysM [Nevskia sp.]